jgi:uncharacterized protein
MYALSALGLRLLLGLAAALLATVGAAAGEPHWPPTISIGTASAGGTYNVYGEALARILTRELKTAVWARPTEGPSENIKLIESGVIDLGFVTLGVAQQAWNGSGDWTNGVRYRQMRAIFPMYDTPFQFLVPRDSAVVSAADLAGKRVGAGPAGGTTGIYMPQFFKVLQVDARLETGSWSQLATRLLDGSLDALAVAAGAPFPSFAELERKIKVRYLPLTPQQIVTLRLSMPELGPSLVAAGTYPSLLRHYPTVGLFNFAVAQATLPSDLVYAIVDAVFSCHEELLGYHAAAAETVPGNFTRNSFLPFHAGAAEWYNRKATTGIVRGD